MSITPATVLNARKVTPIEGQMDLFGSEDEPDPTTEDTTESTTTERKEQ